MSEENSGFNSSGLQKKSGITLSNTNSTIIKGKQEYKKYQNSTTLNNQPDEQEIQRDEMLERYRHSSVTPPNIPSQINFYPKSPPQSWIEFDFVDEGLLEEKSLQDLTMPPLPSFIGWKS